MTKYNFGFKLDMAHNYLNGKGGNAFLSRKHGISDKDDSQLRNWGSNYRQFGEEGLLMSRENNR